ncbi:MAG: adenylate/guanylate cyclase domain-containing protein [Pseudomonadota bacterium]
MADIFDNVIEWLTEQALGDDTMSDIVQAFGTRLVEGGVPITRMSIGRSILHPTIGLLDMQWERENNQVTTQTVPRSFVRGGLDLNNPFADLAAGKVDRIVADLTDPGTVAKYKLFGDLAARGITGYAAFGRWFGRQQNLYTVPSEEFRGASVSFATKRLSGFSPDDIEGFERILPALCVCLRMEIERFVTAEILQSYLGTISSKQVLTGKVERGDGQQIECAIFYSDLRGSVALSQSLDTQAYLDTINAYFDCTATAVSEHGGEVLKFIGDGVLAIFPFDDTTRPRANMCAAALSSAQDACARAVLANAARAQADLPPLQFGIGLHLSTVIYGNVGTAHRLDFTATGPAVGLASRCEGMTRTLDKPVLATGAFADLCPVRGTDMGTHSLRGFDDPIGLVSYQTA